MITVKARPAGGIELSDRQSTVRVEGATVTLGDLAITEPGEYEAHGIEVIYGTGAALLVWENIQIAYLFQNGQISQFEKSQFTPCQVLIISDTLTELSASSWASLLEAYDPNVVVASAATKLDANLEKSVTFQETNQAKLAASTLPTEGRDFIKLVG